MTAIADATDSSTVETLIQTVEDLQETVEQQAERIDELETELAEHKDHTGREHADIRRRVTQAEDAVETLENQQAGPIAENATSGTDETTGPQNDETPLKRICSLPEHVADRELTANQERARFIARDIHDYAEKAPAGLVVDSRTIKKVIAAAEGKRPHTQTVARVMDFLADLGKDDVKLTKRRGRKLVVFTPEAANQYAAHHDRCDQGSGPTTGSDVIANP